MNTMINSKLLVFLATTALLFGCSEKEVLIGTGGTGTDGTGGTTGLFDIGKGIGSTFTSGSIEIKNAIVTVNGSTDVTVYIVDSNKNLSKTSRTINFESPCEIQGLASFTSKNVTTTTGIATTTYLDQGCSTSDIVIATAGWNSNLTASGTLSIDSTAPATANTLRIGTGELMAFSEGDIDVTLNNISSDGSTTVSVNLVDSTGNLLTSANSVTFTSDCEQTGKANFTKTIVTTSTGTATTTYNAAGCVGADPITATITIGATVKTATGSVTVAAASAGSIQFTSAEPSLIALKGTGTTTGLPENSTISFTILDGNKEPVSNESVTFSLNSTIGGITLSLYTATSNASGVVTTTLQSGSVATSVRVSAVVDSNALLSTTSEAIAIATGPPDQNSMSLSAETLNPRAWNLDGKKVAITARLADRFNNPIQDGTSVLFTTELGSIDPTCKTENGACTVNWISQDPRGDAANAGRTTILATVDGEESFIDVNANGNFDTGDTFTDLGEAYLDENENGVYDSGELFTDFNGNKVWDAPDGEYSGSGCANNCAAIDSVSVRDSIVLVMSEDNPAIISMGTNGDDNNLCQDYASCLAYRFSGASLSTDTVSSLSVTVAGLSNGQVLPSETIIDFEASNGKIISGAKHTVGLTSYVNSVFVSLTADTTPSNDGALTMKVTIGQAEGKIYDLYIAAINDSGADTGTAPPVPTTARLGTGETTTFNNGALDITTPNLAAGGTTPVSVNIVDDAGVLLTTPYTVNFTSSCVQSGLASFDTAAVVTSTGTATTNYTSSNCEGVDTITATSDSAVAVGDVIVAPAAAGSIAFNSASHSLIALRGTGATSGTPETSDITFTVLNSQGGPVANETVNFSLNSTVGGISLVSATANTNSLGQALATVQSGTVATSVRVTAIVASNTALATTSNAIVIATGPPDQDSISLSAEKLNPLAWDNTVNAEVIITASLADRFNNRIQDGTAISFKTELGSIDGSCTTIDGSCEVTWKNFAPFGTAANAGRTTILATVQGEESFVDNDGDGVFSDGDTFTDLPEAFQDDDENGTYTAGEHFLDLNLDGNWTDISAPPGTYNGAGCTHSTRCNTSYDSVDVRKSLVLVMAEPTPAVIAIGINGYDTDGVSVATCASNQPTTYNTPACICVDGCDGSVVGNTYPAEINVRTQVKTATFTIAGIENRQVLPVGTSITFTNTSNANINGGGDQTVSNTNKDSAIDATDITHYTVHLAPDIDPSAEPDGILQLTVNVPGGNVRNFAPIFMRDD